MSTFTNRIEFSIKPCASNTIDLDDLAFTFSVLSEKAMNTLEMVANAALRFFLAFSIVGIIVNSEEIEDKFSSLKINLFKVGLEKNDKLRPSKASAFDEVFKNTLESHDEEPLEVTKTDDEEPLKVVNGTPDEEPVIDDSAAAARKKRVAAIMAGRLVPSSTPVDPSDEIAVDLSDKKDEPLPEHLPAHDSSLPLACKELTSPSAKNPGSQTKHHPKNTYAKGPTESYWPPNQAPPSEKPNRSESEPVVQGEKWCSKTMGFVKVSPPQGLDFSEFEKIEFYS